MSGTDAPPSTKPTVIRAVRNGPLQVKGDIVLRGSDGADIDLAGQRIVLLCRCGRSQTQPFCDSSHLRTGWVSSDASTAQEPSSQG